MKLAAAALAVTFALVGTAHPAQRHRANQAKAHPLGMGSLTSSLAQRHERLFTMQTPSVSAGCFPPRLRAVLQQIGGHFGARPTITSGFRSRAGRSMHARCLAADIRVPGVSPSRLASYARSIRGVGGVGTYCHTTIVHVDVGPRRNWRDCF